jgi:hypothetical protein
VSPACRRQGWPRARKTGAGQAVEQLVLLSWPGRAAGHGCVECAVGRSGRWSNAKRRAAHPLPDCCGQAKTAKGRPPKSVLGAEGCATRPLLTTKPQRVGHPELFTHLFFDGSDSSAPPALFPNGVKWCQILRSTNTRCGGRATHPLQTTKPQRVGHPELLTHLFFDGSDSSAPPARDGASGGCSSVRHEAVFA